MMLLRALNLVTLIAIYILLLAIDDDVRALRKLAEPPPKVVFSLAPSDLDPVAHERIKIPEQP